MKAFGLCCIVLLFVGQSEADEPEIVRRVQRGEELAARGRVELAIQEYEYALAAGAGSALFLNRLGDLYLEADKLDHALDTFHRSLREKPKQLSLYSRMSEIFLAVGQLDSAIYYVQQARELAPEASPVYSSLAFLFLQAGDLPLTRAYLDTALQLNPYNAEAHRYLGFYFTQIDSLDRAVEHYEQVIALVPEHFEAYNNIAYLALQQGEYEQALHYYTLARERAEEPLILYNVNDRLAAIHAILGGKMRARYILVDSRPKADELYRRIQAGDDFEPLARQFSLAPNAEDGGDVDFFGPGELLPAFEEAVLQLQVGQVGEVVETPMGYLVIQRLN